MSKRVVGYGVMDEAGKLRLSHRARFDLQLIETFKPGERVALTIEKATRNLRQNALYWVWVDIIEKEHGWDPQYTHNQNKIDFNMVTVLNANQKTGELEEVNTPGSTHNLSVDAFAEFMGRVQRGWSERGINLPSSDEEYEAE